MAKECRSRLKPCTFDPCMYSLMHNEDGHKAMLERGNVDRAIQRDFKMIKLAQWHVASQEGSVPVDPTMPMCLYTSNNPGEESGFGVVLYSESWSKGSIRWGKNRPVAMDSIKVPNFNVDLSPVTQELGAIAWGLERFQHHTKQSQVIN